MDTMFYLCSEKLPFRGNNEVMSNSYFRFKRFTIEQSRAAMKVGTDGVLLGAWCALRGEEQDILDVGCGSGLIALMAAQRTRDARIVGIDIDHDSCVQARENVGCSPWPDRVRIDEISLQDFASATEERFDHIISNPPFFLSSLRSPDKARSNARHAVTLPYAALALASALLLRQGGALSVILPFEEASVFIAEAAGCGLSVSRRTDVAPLPDMRLKRVLLELRKSLEIISWDTLVIGNSVGNGYSEQYIALTRDFYLQF